MFTHQFLKRHDLKRIHTGGRRYYKSPSNVHLPSVTTVVKDFYNIDFSGWENSIGKEEADKIRRQAANRGTRFHNLCEKFLLNEQDYAQGAMPDILEDFANVKECLEHDVGTIYGIELKTFSENFMMAGTADLVCEWLGTPSIVDFKTSKKKKREEWIEHYFVQAAIYARMISEQYGLDIPQIVIILVISGERPVIFVRNANDYREKINEIVNFVRTSTAYLVAESS
jgi:genome maintenance exonuclease 1